MENRDSRWSLKTLANWWIWQSFVWHVIHPSLKKPWIRHWEFFVKCIKLRPIFQFNQRHGKWCVQILYGRKHWWLKRKIFTWNYLRILNCDGSGLSTKGFTMFKFNCILSLHSINTFEFGNAAQKAKVKTIQRCNEAAWQLHNYKGICFYYPSLKTYGNLIAVWWITKTQKLFELLKKEPDCICCQSFESFTCCM